MAEYNPSKIIKDGNTYNFRDDTKIPLAGSNAISGDLIPATDNSIDIGSSTKNIKMLYTKGITIDGAQFSPSDYMTLNTTQTVTSRKNYTDYQDINAYRLRIKNTVQEKGVIPESNLWNGFVFCDKNYETMFSIEQGVMANGVIQINFAGRANDNDTTFTTFLRYINSSDLTTNFINVIDLMPFGNGTRKLGDTNAKWKSFNGINPGALSLPGTNLINIASSITVLDGTTANTFTPQVNGWLLINGTGPANEGYIYAVQGRIGMKSVNNQTSLRCAALIPVIAGVEVSVTCKLTTLTWANIAPCQGNV